MAARETTAPRQKVLEARASFRIRIDDETRADRIAIIEPRP
jgi:hypothetical protein